MRSNNNHTVLNKNKLKRKQKGILFLKAPGNKLDNYTLV